MAVLGSKTKNKILMTDLKIAKAFFDRGRGLLGQTSLNQNQALWIHHCNSIHTFFMKFAIDCIFLDKNLKVTTIKNNIAPWRLILPIWSANSVIEMAAGQAQALELKVGEELYVGN